MASDAGDIRIQICYARPDFQLLKDLSVARGTTIQQAIGISEIAKQASDIDLTVCRVGIYGMGRIGRCIARRIEAFGLPVAYHSRRPAEGVAYDYFPSLLELAAAVDVLISIVPGGPTTANSVNAEVLSALGPEGVFINVGRGTVVDEDALINALRTGAIAAAGLDVLADEPNVSDDMLALDNLTILPHIGSASVSTRTAMADLVAQNVIAWFQNGAALTPVP